MGYSKQTFKDKETVLKASHLNHIESGIVENENRIVSIENRVKTSESNIKDNTSQIQSLANNISGLQSGAFSDMVITRYEPISKSVFKGKKLWVFGDSITAGVGTDSAHYFSQLLCDILECASLKRCGHSGYAFSHGINDYGNTILNNMDSVLAGAPGNCDILIICFGINDWTWGRNIAGDRAIGNLLDTTKYTICGAVNIFCQKLQTIFKDHPDVKIYFSTPTPTKNAPISGGNTGKTWDQNKKNFNGNTLRDICNAIIKTAALYGYQSLDLNLYFDGDITDTAAMDIAFPDGLHPSADGNVKMAATLEKLLCANPITSFYFNPFVTTLSPLAKNLIYKTVTAVEAEIPTITLQPVGASYNLNDAANPLKVESSVPDAGTLSYQWYKNGVSISGATTNSYTPLTSDSGTYTYYCLVTNTLGASKKSIQSTTVTITIQGDYVVDDNVEELDLTTLSLNHLYIDGSNNEPNLFYQTSDQTLSVNNTGFNKTSYISTPLSVGHEIELTTYFGNQEEGTTANLLTIYTDDDINNATANNVYFPNSSVFGIYVDGVGNDIAKQWDNMKAEAIPNGEKGAIMNGGKNVKLKLFDNGVKCYIDGVELQMKYYTPLNKGTNYYFGVHANSTSPGRLMAKVEYIGPIR